MYTEPAKEEKQSHTELTKYKDFSAAQSGEAVWIAGERAAKAWDERRNILRPILQKNGLLKEAN